MLTVEEVTDSKGLDAYGPEWDELQSQAPDVDLFVTRDWVISWLEGFWKGRGLRFLFLRDEGSLRAVAPLLEDTSGVLRCADSLAFPVNGHAWRSDILHRGPTGEVVRTVASHLARQGPTRISWSRAAADSPVVRAIGSGATKGCLHVVCRPEQDTPVAYVGHGFGTFFDARSSHVRHELRRKVRRFDRAGTSRVRLVTTAGELGEALRDVESVEARSWKARDHHSFIGGPKGRAFYAALFPKAACQGALRIYLLYLDGRPVAHLVGLRFRDRFHALNTSYDADLAGLSPGQVLMVRAIQDVADAGCTLFDLLGDDARWKLELSTGVRRHVDVCLFSDHLLRCRTCWTLDGQVKPFVRRHLPGVIAAKRRVREWRSGA